MKFVIAVLLIAELLFSYFVLARFLIPVREEHVIAFSAWHNNQSEENFAELERQTRITEWHRLRWATLAFGIMALATFVGARGFQPKRPKDRVLLRHPED